MALKVVPAGDERCDIHNNRQPPAYICKDCLNEYGIEPGRTVTVRRGQRRFRRVMRRPFRPVRRVLRGLGARGRRGILIGAGVALVAGAIAVTVVLANQGGGGGSQKGLPTEGDVVNALDLSPDPSGNGWITLDGACAVLSIEIGKAAQSPQPGVNPASEATNPDGTVRAVVQNAFSQNQAACVARVRSGLRNHF